MFLFLNPRCLKKDFFPNSKFFFINDNRIFFRYFFNSSVFCIFVIKKETMENLGD